MIEPKRPTRMTQVTIGAVAVGPDLAQVGDQRNAPNEANLCSVAAVEAGAGVSPCVLIFCLTETLSVSLYNIAELALSLCLYW